MLDMSACWTAQPIAVIDTETCGLDPADGICEIAVVRIEAMHVVSSWSSLVKPNKPIPEAATKIHGIRDADVAGAPSLPELAGELLKRCVDAVPCAYSSDFDMAFLRAQIAGTDCAAFDPAFTTWVDPLTVVRDVDRWQKGPGRHRLENVCRRWGVTLSAAHRARGDAEATAGLLLKLHEVDKLPAMPLGQLLARIAARKAAQQRDFDQWKARQPPRQGEAS